MQHGSSEPQAVLVDELRGSLEGACPESRVELRGSLARGAADAYSDIDLAWVVPDERFADAVATDRLRVTLGSVRRVASIRADPDFRQFPAAAADLRTVLWRSAVLATRPRGLGGIGRVR